MSDDLTELNDRELNYTYFETDSDDASNKSDEDFVIQKSLFYFKQFSIVRNTEGFYQRYSILENALCISKCGVFFLFLFFD